MKNIRVTITTAGDVSTTGPIAGYLARIRELCVGYSLRAGDGCWVGAAPASVVYSEPSTDIVVLCRDTEVGTLRTIASGIAGVLGQRCVVFVVERVEWDFVLPPAIDRY